MDQAIRNKLRNVVTQCRKLLEEAVAQVLQGQFGIHASGKKDEVHVEDEARMKNLSEEDKGYRRDILAHLEHIEALGYKPKDALAQLVREIAFTHLNRLCAYKMMEAREVWVAGQRFREAVSRSLKSQGFQFYLADHSEDKKRFDSGHQDVAYRHFLGWLGALLSEEIGVLFSPTDPANRLFPPQRVLDDVLALLNSNDLKDIWGQDETIGWVYQYFTPKELRDQARKESAAPRNSYELAFRNQFFTPRYVVEFLTDNTLGRIWYEMRKGDTKLRDQCRFLVRRASEVFLAEGQSPPEPTQNQDGLSQEELLKQQVNIPFRPKKDPRELRILDPACGSGHFLLYCFDLLLTIYEEAYADPDLGPKLKEDYPTLEALRRDAPRLILAHNLHGIDIDPRATQIAALALWLRCQRAYREMGLKQDRPKITKSNIVCAEPMPGEKGMLREFVAEIQPSILRHLVEVVFDKMKLAGEAGSLLKIEVELRDAIAEAKRQWAAEHEQATDRKGRPLLFSRAEMERVADKTPQPQLFDFSEMTDEQFWNEAEKRVLDALRDYASHAANGARLHRQLFAGDAAQGFSFIDLCQKQFDVVLMNPPFGLTTPLSFSLFKTHYPESYTELLSTFVERGVGLSSGYVGAITSRSFMVATRLRNWRATTIVPRIRFLGDLGPGVMDAALVEAAAYVLAANPAPAQTLIAFDVRAAGEKMDALASDIAGFCGGTLTGKMVSTNLFTLFPSNKVLYSLSSQIVSLVKSGVHFEPAVGTARQGMTTWDDFRFIRLRWEVRPVDIGPGKRWEFLAKGGAYARYFGDIHLVVMWNGDGREIRDANIRVNGTDAQARQASDYWRRPGNTYSLRSGKGFSCRVLPKGCLFTSQGPVIFSESDIDNIALLGWINTKLITTLVELQSNAGKFMSGIIKTLPWKPQFNEKVPAHLIDETRQAVLELWSVESCDDTQAMFSGLPSSDSISHLSGKINGGSEEIRNRIVGLDAEWNRFVNALYGVSNESIERLREQNAFADHPSDEHDDGDEESGTGVTLSETCLRLISVVVGVVFERWNSNKCFRNDNFQIGRDDPYEQLPPLPPAMVGDATRRQDQVGQPARTVDYSPVVPDDPDHPDDILRRVRQVLELIWKDQAEAMEMEACEILGVKELRDYFRKPGKGEFWDDHVSRYSKSRRKAPIYWLLQSSKRNYGLWLYYHRLDKDILFKALLNYVEPKVRLEQSRLDTLRAQRSALGDDARGARKIAKDIERQEALLGEVTDFEEKLRRAANLDFGKNLDSSVIYDPDLNDGVVLNIAPLWELVPWKEAKGYWDELLAGEYEWSSMGKLLRKKGLVK